MKRLGRKLAVSVLALVTTLALAEAVARWSAEPAFDAAAARRRTGDRVAALSGDRWGAPAEVGADAEPVDEPEHRLHPYFGYDVSITDFWTTRDLNWFRSARAASTVKVLVMGGSVAAAFNQDCGRQLQEQLAQDPRWSGWAVRVFGEGRGGFRQPQQLHLLEYLLAVGFEPDIVVELDGFNEVAIGLQNARLGVHPVMPSYSHWAHLATNAPLSPEAMDQIAAVRREQRLSQSLFERADAFGLFHSALGSALVDSLVAGCHRRYTRADSAYRVILERPEARTYSVGPTFEGDDVAAVELSAKIWAQSSLEMNAICELHGIRYVHFLQPTLHDEGSKPLTDDERRIGAEPEHWALGAKLGYPKLRARAAELLAGGVEFVDLSQAFAEVREPLYVDLCHFTLAGNQLLAQRMIPVLAARPPEAPPPGVGNAPPARKRPKRKRLRCVRGNTPAAGTPRLFAGSRRAQSDSDR